MEYIIVIVSFILNKWNIKNYNINVKIKYGFYKLNKIKIRIFFLKWLIFRFKWMFIRFKLVNYVNNCEEME